MDMLLGGLAFGAVILGQFAAVIVVTAHGMRTNPEFEMFGPSRLDHRARLIWESGS